MSDTTFVDGSTLTAADWFNDLNDFFYTAAGGVAGAGTITKIQFPASQSASSDANALDDYEEGNWTPVIAFATAGDSNIAHSSQVGRYTKIGRLVVVSFTAVTSTFTHSTASGNLQVTGLPFTCTSAIDIYGSGIFQGITKASYTQIIPRAASNGTVITFHASGSGQSLATITASDTPTGGSMILQGTIAYIV